MKRVLSYLIILFLSVQFLLAQTTLDLRDIAVTSQGINLKSPFIGGMNLPQFSPVDLNNDGIKDLFCFDKEGNVIMTWLNKGTANQIDYEYAPEYVDNFPTLSNWAMLRDYNCDGIADILAYELGSATLFEGYYDSNNEIAFTNVINRVQHLDPRTGVITHIPISGIDYPAFDDLDGDGDLDILTFGSLGGYVELYRNYSAENGNGCGLDFRLETDCWGRFYESGISKNLDLSDRVDSCWGKPNFILENNRPLHTGSTVLTLDIDNDNDKEIILGDVSFPNLVMGINGGTNTTAFITDQDTAFPSNTTSVNVPNFPAGFHLDINNDGIKDLVVSPHAKNISENYFVGWYYQNIGSNQFPEFVYRQKDFMVNTMIDLGRGARPTFFDYNADGLLDLLIGNFGYYGAGGNYDTRLFLFENTGTSTVPAFTLIEDDYLEISRTRLIDVHPTVGDIDNDGDVDIIIGESDGKIHLIENIAGAGNPAVFNGIVAEYGGIDIGQHSTPQLVDLDGDNKLDLVIGEKTGNLNYYQNQGTLTNPMFRFITDNLGRVDTRGGGSNSGYSAPYFVKENNVWVLYTGSDAVNISQYTNIDTTNLEAPFNLREVNFGGIDIGRRTSVAVADLDDDGDNEFIAGNFRGGLGIYGKPLSISNQNLTINNNPFKVFPNPTNNIIHIHANNPLTDATLLITNTLGQTILQTSFEQYHEQETKHWAKGMYYIIVKTPRSQSIKKLSVL